MRRFFRPRRRPPSRADQTGETTRRAHRLAVGADFGLLGVAVGVWVARLPEIEENLAIDHGTLGLTLLFQTIGALVTMPIAGRLAPRLGARRIVIAASAAICLLLPMIPLASTPLALMVVLTAFGASTGIYGVVVNALAIHVEGIYERSILSSFHGLFSLGCAVGSIVAAGLGRVGLDLASTTAITSGAVAVGLMLAYRWLPETSTAPAGTRGWSVPRPELLILGGFAFLGLLAEGAMGDWSAIYLGQDLKASGTLAALGYAAYSSGMMAGRFTGDRLSVRLGDRALLQGGAAVATLGLIASMAWRSPAVALVGFTAVGAGLSNVVPILYRSASRTPGVAPVAGIATASTLGYFGFLAGPPLIGAIAQISTLATGLGFVAATVAAIAVAGGIAINPARPEPAPASA